MKRLAFTVAIAISAATAASAQVGINTENPTATLHVVGDTAHVKGNALRIVDGNEGAGKVLTSDNNGTATWKEEYTIHNVGTVPPNPASMDKNAWRYTGYNVTVPPGNSLLFMGVMVINTVAENGYLTFNISESAASNNVNPNVSSVPHLAAIPVMAKTSAQVRAQSTSQVMFNVRNTSASPVTVYIWGTLSSEFSSNTAVNLGGNPSYAEPFIFVQQ